MLVPNVVNASVHGRHESAIRADLHLEPVILRGFGRAAVGVLERGKEERDRK